MLTMNKLATEKSPYLLQHATNPVHWLPWGDEAFEKALREDKPILVAIGYATCHWCHVMERESFENPDIAEVMICMFGPTSDRYGLLHRGTRCRKMHSSYRSTFRTIGDIPLAMVSPTSFTILNDDYRRRDKTRVPVIDPVYDDRTTILYYYPGMKPDLVDALVEKGYRDPAV